MGGESSRPSSRRHPRGSGLLHVRGGQWLLFLSRQVCPVHLCLIEDRLVLFLKYVISLKTVLSCIFPLFYHLISVIALWFFSEDANVSESWKKRHSATHLIVSSCCYCFISLLTYYGNSSRYSACFTIPSFSQRSEGLVWKQTPLYNIGKINSCSCNMNIWTSSYIHSYITLI